METNQIGLPAAEANDLAADLDGLLAHYHIYYQNLRGFHWNVRGKDFFELHLKFEEFYNDALLKIDEIAERILTLGHHPVHTFSDYIRLSGIKEQKNVTDGTAGIQSVAESLKTLVSLERTILKKAADCGDEGTVSLMSDYISQQEKTIWMIKAYLG